MILSELKFLRFRHILFSTFADGFEKMFHFPGGLKRHEQLSLSLTHLCKSMWNLPGPKHTVALLRMVNVISDFYHKLAFQHIPKFILFIVKMKRWTSIFYARRFINI